MLFHKYQALGNDYLIFDPSTASAKTLSQPAIRRICHRHFGIGSDGILYGPCNLGEGNFGLRIYNPDGGEAEKSGNGLRIFARYLWDSNRVSDEAFTVDTQGGQVTCRVADEGRRISVDMGQVNFHSAAIPVAGPPREVLDETIEIKGNTYRFYAATVGNPHVVLPMATLSKALACDLGPQLESHPWFPNRTNVQFLKVLDCKRIQIEIWERGAGYTLASGSSSCAAAAVAYKMGAVEADITVCMPGGEILTSIDESYRISIDGPVARVGTVNFDDEALQFPDFKGDLSQG